MKKPGTIQLFNAFYSEDENISKHLKELYAIFKKSFLKKGSSMFVSCRPKWCVQSCWPKRNPFCLCMCNTPKCKVDVS